MRITRFMFLLVLGTNLAALSGAPAERIAGFTALSEGDELGVKLLSVDCFSTWRAYEFTFSRSTNAAVSVFKLEGARGQGTNEVELLSGLTNRVFLGFLALTERDLLRLDELLAFYRRRLARGMTTHEHVFMTQWHRGQKVAREDFYDAADFMFYAYQEKRSGVIDLQWLLFRLERQNERNKR